LPGSLYVHKHVANMQYSFTICTLWNLQGPGESITSETTG
jgi:hypothetical protein